MAANRHTSSSSSSSGPRFPFPNFSNPQDKYQRIAEEETDSLSPTCTTPPTPTTPLTPPAIATGSDSVFANVMIGGSGKYSLYFFSQPRLQISLIILYEPIRLKISQPCLKVANHGQAGCNFLLCFIL